MTTTRARVIDAEAHVVEDGEYIEMDPVDEKKQKLQAALEGYREELADAGLVDLTVTVAANSLPLNNDGNFSASLAVKETACAGAAVGAAYLLDPVEGTIAVASAVSVGVLTAYNHVKNDGCESIREFFLRRPVRSVKKLFGS